MKNKIFLTIITVFLFLPSIMAQEDVQIGSGKFYQRMQGGFFDYSDPSGINIKVQIWGYVKYPGYYVIPARSSINELISLAGGPSEDALLEDVRILRFGPDSVATMYRYNYNDLLWSNEMSVPVKFARVNAGDMLIIPGEPRYFVREDVGFYLGVTNALASIAILIVSLLK
jgi:hypothetical protein